MTKTTANKTRKLYQVREDGGNGNSSRQIGIKMRLLERAQALRVAKFLKHRGINAFIAPLTIAA